MITSTQVKHLESTESTSLHRTCYSNRRCYANCSFTFWNFKALLKMLTKVHVNSICESFLPKQNRTAHQFYCKASYFELTAYPRLDLYCQWQRDCHTTLGILPVLHFDLCRQKHAYTIDASYYPCGLDANSCGSD